MNDNQAASSPPWIELPRDVTVNILRRLGPEEMLNTAERVCTTWRSVCSGEPSLWQVIHIKYPHQIHTLEKRDYADILCRRAVDRSQGELIEININNFASNDLLRYISKRSTHLKILSLESCCDISSRSLFAAVKNFHHLEELHLFFMPSISRLDIKAIGVSCPMLKSFTFANHRHELAYFRMMRNSDALSIAENMPNLVRLGLFGNLLNNEGLLALLNGCPKLVALDLRRCSDVDLQCDLGKRCSEQIKELRRPLDDPEVEDDVYSGDDIVYDHDAGEDGVVWYRYKSIM